MTQPGRSSACACSGPMLPQVCTHIFCFAMVVAGTASAYMSARREGRDPPLQRVLLLPATCLTYLLALAGARLSLEQVREPQQHQLEILLSFFHAADGWQHARAYVQQTAGPVLVLQCVVLASAIHVDLLEQDNEACLDQCLELHMKLL